MKTNKMTSLVILAIIGMMAFCTIVQAQSVKLTEVQWQGTGCYRIEMPMGTVYFEKDKGVSGFKSFIDPQGNDWISSYYGPGPNSNYRGFPNSIGNFGHAGRDSGSTTTIVDGKTEGDFVILESTNGKFTFQYWFFADHIAIKVLKSEGEYPFLFEGVIGGSSEEEDFFVTADGKKHIPTKDGEFDDFTPEWIYLGDPKVNHVLFLAKTPEDDAPNENHRQVKKGKINMDLYSFGRTGQEHKYEVRGMSGNEHICVIGFAPASRTHAEMTAMIEGFLAKPFSVSETAQPSEIAPAASTVVAQPTKPAQRWSSAVLRHDAAWFASDDARALADSVVQYQSTQGGWPKSTNIAIPPRTPDDIPPEGQGRANSLDNGATTLPMEFLARVVHATGEKKYNAAFSRGLDYLFAAQYPNGGWPQFWPLRGDKYYSRITYNDDAMIRVITLLNEVASGDSPYTFVAEDQRKKAAVAVQSGIECILKTQIKQNGKLTAWCAQHDEKTLEPAWARAYEPPSLSGGESVGIVQFLMSIEKPTPEIIAAVEGAVDWLQRVAIQGKRMERVRREDGRRERVLIDDPESRLWARFYELQTNRPLFLDRDSVFLYDYSKVGYERRSGYSYFGTGAEKLIDRDYPQWQKRLKAASDQ